MAGRLTFLALVLAVGALVGLSTAGPAQAATIVVKNANDSGPDSLRAAIIAANATPELDTVKFSIPGAGGHTITLASALPAITTPVILNAQTQPGYAGKPLIRLDGSAIGPIIGLQVTGGGSTMKGFSMTGFSIAIQLVTGGVNTVSGCWLGLDLSGAAAGNGTGVAIASASANNVIGGTNAAARNVISASAGDAVGITSSGATGNVVEGNYLGTNVGGNSAVPNHGGVTISNGASDNAVGGTSAGARNVISGNSLVGVQISGFGADRNVVAGNYIGVAASGKSRLANGAQGVDVRNSATANTIGGTAAGARNVISGNGAEGVSISAPSNVVAANYVGTDATGSYAIDNATGIRTFTGADGTTIGGATAGARNVVSGNQAAGIGLGAGAGILVQGNYIGVDKTGTSVLRNNQGIVVQTATNVTIGGAATGAGNVVSGNAVDGIVATGGTGTTVQGNRIGPAATGSVLLGNGGDGVELSAASDNSIGGTAAGAGNVIAGNIGTGVLVNGSAATGNSIRGNSIFDNRLGAIVLGGGSNHSQPPPSVESVATSAGSTTIVVHLDAAASSEYAIELFGDPTCDPGGSPRQGKQFLDAKTMVTNVFGKGGVTFVIPALASETGVTATATRRSTLDTSRFSACAAAP